MTGTGTPAAEAAGLAARLHREAFIADAHTDALLAAIEGRDLLERGSEGHVDLPRLLEAGVTLQVFALWAPDRGGPAGYLPHALRQVAHFWRTVEGSKGRLRPVLSRRDLDALQPAQGVVGGLLSIEGGEILQGQLEMLEVLHRLGVRALGLTWNNRNALADGCRDAESGGGLTRFGRAVVAACGKLGVTLDVSHLSERGFWDLLELSEGPVIASHSNAQAVHDHPRNLTDGQLVALAQRGGVVGLNFHPGFLTDSERCTSSDLIRHALHIADVAGPEHLGLGSDFDGISRTPEDLPDVTALPRLTEALLAAGFTEDQLRGILGGNFRRVFQTTLPQE
ncbi:dipeptidase [Limnochorda pilosa]|uniref:Dipeptidase n=1 Tax=Limnochorda pilosa TaxID=1555112 RepID=A0A0K2SKN3_LIMPI|nr:dipeptidase [Limnochorda pilosa]BAS27645.1 dipeptidase [Limnochorda pilosa]